MVQHTHEVIANLQQLRFAMVSIEASSRGYSLTGDESFLERFRASVSSVAREEATRSHADG
ncbi:MAG: CHASE3 domain-containing protein [Gammaproteobacteria bacterium]